MLEFSFLKNLATKMGTRKWIYNLGSLRQISVFIELKLMSASLSVSFFYIATRYFKESKE
jgi:hypothetical protein